MSATADLYRLWSRAWFDSFRVPDVDGWRTSDIGGPCLKETILKRIGVPRRAFTDSDINTLQGGTFRHGLVKWAFRDLGILEAMEFELYDKHLNLYSHPDTIIGGTAQVVEQPSPGAVEFVELLTGLAHTDAAASYKTFLHEVRNAVLFTFGAEIPRLVVEIKTTRKGGAAASRDKGFEYYRAQCGGQALIARRNPEQLPVPVEGFEVFVLDADGEIAVGEVTPAWEKEAEVKVRKLTKRYDWYEATGELPGCTCWAGSGNRAGWRDKYCAFSFGDKVSCCERAYATYVTEQAEKAGAI